MLGFFGSFRGPSDCFGNGVNAQPLDVMGHRIRRSNRQATWHFKKGVLYNELHSGANSSGDRPRYQTSGMLQIGLTFGCPLADQLWVQANRDSTKNRARTRNLAEVLAFHRLTMPKDKIFSDCESTSIEQL